MIRWATPVGTHENVNHRIHRYHADASIANLWGSQGAGSEQVSFPRGIAIGADGTVYVADNGNDRIQRFDLYGNFLTMWGSEGMGTGQFSGPAGVADYRNCAVAVADTSNDRVQLFQPVL